MRNLIYLFLFFCMLGATVSTANAATFTVNTTADTQDSANDGLCLDSGGNCSLRAAITESNRAAGADIITLPAGTYTITIAEASDNANVNGDFDLTSEITINGAGSGTTIVQANAARGVATGRVFHLRAAFPMALNDMTVRYGRYTTAASTFGAGIRVDTAAVNATLTNVIVTENDDGTSGGGLAISGAAGSVTTLNNCTISNNTAGGTSASSSIAAGVMLNAVATLNINNSTITGNSVSNTSTTVSASGGGIASVSAGAGGTLNITNSTISNNISTSSGFNAFTGGVHVTSGTTTITGSMITGNSASLTAGAAANFATVGGVYNQQATVSIIDSTISNNTTSNVVTPANAFHGGVRTLSSTIAATTNITNSTISGNTANSEGGGVVNISGGATNATTNITGSTISGNMATGATGLAGGLENFNASTGLATVNVLNSTISGNSAADAAGSYNGGSASTINYNFSTIASNTATTSGGGVFQDTTGTTNLKNSIIGDNTAPTGPDISGTITSQDYNHVEDTTGGTFLFESAGKSKRLITTNFFALPNDITGTDPMLGALGNNGGTTNTHLPAVASPVMNTIPNGTNDCGTTVTTSQNANTRPQATGCEKGAAERLAVLAAAASIGGRVSAADGAGIRNAVIVVTGGTLSQPIYVRTGAFGYYNIEGLEVGETYVLTINSKRFTFANPNLVISLQENVEDANFVALP